MDLRVRRLQWFSAYRVHHRVAERFRVGRVFLLGDAAHIHSPVGGQGMNTGIGDAVNLAWKLAAVIGGNGGEELLDSYATERMAFAERLVNTTDRAFTFVTRTGRLARFVRMQVVPRVLPVLFSMPAFRRLMFRTVSQIDVRYRDSALSEGHVGRVQAGDRLPWCRLSDDGRDNHALLATLRWQVHVYGSATEALRAWCARSAVDLHELPLSAHAERAGFVRNAIYLVRPDGHVGFAGDASATPALQAYVRRILRRSGTVG
jgi:hypothetical protein